MRPKRLLHTILWGVVFLLLIHILSMAVFSGGSWPLNWSKSNIDDLEDDELTWSARQIHSAGGPLDREVLARLQRPRWQMDNLNPDEKTGPLLLKRRSPVGLDSDNTRTLPPEFLYEGLVLRNRSEMRRVIDKINSQQQVLNAELYNRTDFVIVVQVHDRGEYLKLLIESLRRAKDIHRALVVFSHDVYSANMNRLVRSIGFCRVIQVFFPYSQQLYTNIFPGEDPKDCPRNVNKDQAQQVGCQNAMWPDSYGHYREVAYVQTKHHWFWKVNFLFERVREARDYKGPVLFLEEDHYVAEDFLHMLNLMNVQSKELFPFVNVLCLGTYEKKMSYTPHTGRVQVGKWVSSLHNMGMAFDRNVWFKIKSCVKEFCDFDDYNWDWSLQYVSMKCIPNNLQVMLLKHSPRVFHIGQCGVHHKKKLCSPHSLVAQLNRLMDSSLALLYPSSLNHIGPVAIRARVPKPNGGWGDLRDRALCKSFVLGRDKDFPIVDEPSYDLTFKEAWRTRS